MPLNKQQRQDLIRRIITEKKISTQFQLLQELRKLGYYNINQPTISRDLREIGVIKTARGLGPPCYNLAIDSQTITMANFRNKFKNFVQDIRHTGNLILIITLPGDAQGVAKVIDKANFKNILGTVAGDDTILVVVDKPGNVKKLLKTFNKARFG
ncbi:arginine repressor [candidate division WOR-3 bacterium 4484_100]|uniref:Arginine repressor n=1 Tax=candidate division WOR-3 bacterium 4484_100 TaxID=1936077 RepID=A0A1V4QGD5_UNCW3|nr:MAG: arginine repressor [candidate division WOR-3 bacterium 4484_100]